MKSKAAKKHGRRWQLQEAKNRLSEVVRRAMTDGPQTITLHGKDAVVVTRAPGTGARPLADAESSPPSLLELFRALRSEGVELKPIALELRDIDLARE